MRRQMAQDAMREKYLRRRLPRNEARRLSASDWLPQQAAPPGKATRPVYATSQPGFRDASIAATRAGQICTHGARADHPLMVRSGLPAVATRS